MDNEDKGYNIVGFIIICIVAIVLIIGCRVLGEMQDYSEERVPMEEEVIEEFFTK